MSHQIPPEDVPGPTRPAPPSPALQESLKRYWRSKPENHDGAPGRLGDCRPGLRGPLRRCSQRLQPGGLSPGFWFAQQGSIIVFVILILIYSLLLNRLDAKHHAEMVGLRQSGREEKQ